MKKKCAAQLRHRVASTRRISTSAFLEPHNWICWALFCVLNVSAYANIITVTNTNDSGPGSLRQALADANDGDTINFAVSGTIYLTSGELLIEDSVVISGPGQFQLTVRPAQGAYFRIFHVMPDDTVTIGDLTISNGDSLTETGGALLNDHATTTVMNCSLTSNVSWYRGGAIDNAGVGGSGTLTVLNSSLTGNYAGSNKGGGDGGAIYNESGSTLTVVNSTISNNTAYMIENFGGAGGGILNNGGTLDIDNSTISSNQAGASGGGIWSYGPTTITNSTISNNSVGLFQIPAGIGGGISTFGTSTISNCTISGNYANGNTFKGGGEGGGIYVDGSLDLRNSTLTGNGAGVHGGNIYGGSFGIGNSILNAGTPENIFSGGGVTSQGYNVCSDDGGGLLNGPGDQINTNPMLGPLQDNGGPTFTHELLTGSPAIDAGNPIFTPPPYYDQRGPDFWRMRNGRIDAGSFEVQAGSTPTPTPTATATPTTTSTPIPTPTPMPRATPIPRARPSPHPRP